MSQTEKAFYYKALKAAGATFEKHYREYSTEQFKAACTKIVEENPTLAVQVGLINPPPTEQTYDLPGEPRVAGTVPPLTEAELDELAGAEPPPPPPLTEKEIPFKVEERQVQPGSPPPVQRSPQPTAPVSPRDPNEFAGQRLNTNPDMQPIRTDPETGYVWFQEEVLKPSYPKPRARRVLNYVDTGTQQSTVKDGEYTETFEVAGRGAGREAQAKITMPSYQVGIYKDRRFPFKIICYNGKRGFDREDVDRYYGGSDLVPVDVKRTYVENVLCYDMRTVIRNIQEAYRHLQLTGKV